MVRLYLVDDHAMLRDGMRALLEGAGHQVVGEAGEPTRALSDVLRLEPDVVLLDLSMGERSGLELLEELHKRQTDVRCIVLTMSLQPRHVAEALRLGAAGYLLKGSPATELLKAVQLVLQGRRYLSPEVAELAVQALNASPGSDRLADLSPRERQIVAMVARGQSSAAIGAQLHLSPKTVDTYRSRLMSKLDLSDSAAVVRWAIRVGLIDNDTA